MSGARGAFSAVTGFMQKGFEELKCKGREACEKVVKLVRKVSLTGEQPTSLLDYQPSTNVNGTETSDDDLITRILRLYELCKLDSSFFNKPITEKFITEVKDSISNLLSLIISIEISQELTQTNLETSIENVSKLSDAVMSFKSKFGKPSLPNARQLETLFGSLTKDETKKKQRDLIYTFLQDIYNPIQYRVSKKFSELETIISNIKGDIRQKEGEISLRQKLGLLEAAGYGTDNRTFQQKLADLKDFVNKSINPGGGGGGGGGGSSGMGGRRKQKKTRKRKSNAKRANKSRRR